MRVDLSFVKKGHWRIRLLSVTPITMLYGIDEPFHRTFITQAHLLFSTPPTSLNRIL